MENWTSWVLASAVFLALYDIVKKASVNANAVLPVLLASTTFGFAAYSVGLLVAGHSCAPSEISSTVLSLGLAKSVIVGTSWVLPEPRRLVRDRRRGVLGDFVHLGQIRVSGARPAG